ncbi:hypothetical protein SUGI_1086950 [Cryptomeria japonica]|nr:hypothetical protein SUGI_1086950 [Cryptomeria japonica]
MLNGSLDFSLFCEEGKAERALDWKTRFEIALGIARGLVYLHEECRDFGLAKLVGRDFRHVLTTTRGTPGYLAPEWISGLLITLKVDVYSFGMMLLEIISGIVYARIASEANIEEVRRAVVVGGLCIQEDENRRPRMGEVVKILEGTMELPVEQIRRSLEVLFREL